MQYFFLRILIANQRPPKPAIVPLASLFALFSQSERSLPPNCVSPFHACPSCRDNGTILLSKETDSSDLSLLDKNDFKITLKIFMGRFEFAQIRDCISSLLEQLGIDVISQLIVAFPTDDDTEVPPLLYTPSCIP